MLQVNSQLLDTVQHKVRLGEQLDEMEVNIVSQIQARRIKFKYFYLSRADVELIHHFLCRLLPIKICMLNILL